MNAAMEPRLAGCRTVAAGRRDAPGIVILCHGFAMQPEDLASFAASLGVDAWWLLPEAPIAAALAPGTVKGRSWWRIDPVARLEALRRGPRDFASVNPPDLPAARALLGRILDEALAIAGARPVVLAGFSSGGMLAFDLMLHEPRPVAGLALLSATRIAWQDQAPLLACAPLRGLPVLLTHGKADDDLAFEAGEALREAVSAAGASVTWAEYEGGHEIPLVAWNRLRRWLKPLIDRV